MVASGYQCLAHLIGSTAFAVQYRMWGPYFRHISFRQFRRTQKSLLTLVNIVSCTKLVIKYEMRPHILLHPVSSQPPQTNHPLLPITVEFARLIGCWVKRIMYCSRVNRPSSTWPPNNQRQMLGRFNSSFYQCMPPVHVNNTLACRSHWCASAFGMPYVCDQLFAVSTHASVPGGAECRAVSQGSSTPWTTSGRSSWGQ